MRLPETKRIIFYGVMTFLLYASFYLVGPIREILGDTAQSPRHPAIFLGTVAILLAATLLYSLGMRLDLKANTFRYSLIFFVLFILVLAPLKPVTSTDLYSYIYQSRVLSAHNENPLITPYANFEQDSLYDELSNSWSHQPSPYGPLFVYTGTLLARLGGDNLFLNLLLFKLLMVLCLIASAWLIFRITQSRKAFYLFAWNPLVIFEFVLNGHNDIVPIMLLLAGFYVYKRHSSDIWRITAWILILLSICVKPLVAVLLPFVLIAFTNSAKKRISYLALALLSCLVVSLLYLPLYSGTDIFVRLITQAKQTNGLFVSPMMFLFSLILHGIGVTNIFYLSSLISRSLFLILFMAFFYNTFKKKLDFGSEAFFPILLMVYTAMVALFFTWLMPWYLGLLVALYCLAFPETQKKTYNEALVGISIFGILFYILLR